MASIRPVASSIATTPCTRPSSTSSLRDEPLVVARDRGVLQRGLEQRVQHVEAGLVGGEPGAHLLHAAERAHRDVAVRLAGSTGQPQCSSCSSSRGASCTNASTASWSQSQSLPETVS